MKIVFRDNRFEAVDLMHGDAAVLMTARFRLEPKSNRWYAPNVTVAARLRQHADESANNQFERCFLRREPWPGGVPLPANLTPLPFQIPAVVFGLERNRFYWALDPGLGKTICAALYFRALKARFPLATCAYVCPPFLVKNTLAEFRKWCPEYTSVDLRTNDRADVVVIPDTLLDSANAPASILFVDEAHRFKCEDSKRTKALLTRWLPLYRRVGFLSGTAMPNARPIEIYPILNAAAPETIGFMNRFQFGKRYCGAFFDGYGWNFQGASNMKELAKRVIGPFMLRLKKADVLKSLPPKVEELVFIDGDMPPTLAHMDQSLLARYSPEDLMGHLAPNGHISTYRKELGKHKARFAVGFIKEVMDGTCEKVLVFAIHKDVVKELREKLKAFNPVVIDGDVPPHRRQALAEAFQNNPAHRLFIGNIQAAGIGLNLFAATRVIFVEFSWVPSENDQASDRAHRIGQKDMVFVQYLVYQNSIDRDVMESNFRKKLTLKQME